MSLAKKIFFSALCLFHLALYAQPGVKATVSKQKILIGEQFTLTLETRLPANQPLPVITIDTIPHFEILDSGMPMEAVAGQEKLIKQEYILTSFDSGHWVIPVLRIAGKYLTDTIPMDVVFSDFDPNQDYHDIADIIDVEPAVKEQWWWWLAGGALLLILLIIWIIARRKKPAPVTEKEIDPFTEAMASLEAIQNKTGQPKEFYTALTNIFRLYVFRKKGITSMQKTTDDLILQLHGLPFTSTQYSNLSQALRLGDFVKFAKYNPNSEDNRFAFDEIKQSISDIEKMN